LPGLVRAPASVTDRIRDELPGLGVVLDARYAALEAIPVRALSAYQRAETVMSSADPSCHVSWQLIAAIGKVESNHGRFGGALMTADGVVHPAILGPRLTGHQQTSRISDTDAGRLDGDTTYDLDGRRRGRRRRRAA
jgi:membrane-bound lytic murein transglycosylase B